MNLMNGRVAIKVELLGVEIMESIGFVKKI